MFHYYREIATDYSELFNCIPIYSWKNNFFVLLIIAKYFISGS